MLGENRYGKRNVRFLRVVKDTERHQPYVSGFLFLFAARRCAAAVGGPAGRSDGWTVHALT